VIAETKRPKYKSQRHKSCMMNRQIRVEKIIGTVKCVASCGAIEIQAVETSIRLPRYRYSAGGPCGHLLVHSINWFANRKTLNDFTVYSHNMI